MRTRLNDVGSIAGIALFSLIATTSPGPAAAMSAGAQPAMMHVGQTNVYRVDTAGDPLNGRRLFLENNCYICHGGRGGGGMCPSLRATRPDKNDVRDAVLNGTRSGMPSFARLLTDLDIADLAAYIKSMRSANEPVFNEWWLPLPQ
jgi:mono/diheme cytochrome c family protein